MLWASFALVLLAIAPWSTTDPNLVAITAAYEPPSSSHWLGTDALGRDLLARLIYGGRTSLLVAVLGTSIAAAIAIVLGSIAGLGRWWIDAIVSRFGDAVRAFPALVGALALTSALRALLGGGSRLPALFEVALVIGAVSWTPLFRFLRTELQQLQGGDLSVAARACGAAPLRVAWRHLLPLALGPAAVPIAFTAASALTVEAGISFLGLGVQPPAASLGNLLAEGAHQVGAAWWVLLGPGLALLLAVLLLNLAAERWRIQWQASRQRAY